MNWMTKASLRRLNKTRWGKRKGKGETQREGKGGKEKTVEMADLPLGAYILRPEQEKVCPTERQDQEPPPVQDGQKTLAKKEGERRDDLQKVKRGHETCKRGENARFMATNGHHREKGTSYSWPPSRIEKELETEGSEK